MGHDIIREEYCGQNAIALVKGKIRLLKQDDEFIIERITDRSHVHNKVNTYEIRNDDGTLTTHKLNYDVANVIIDAIMAGKAWSDAFLIDALQDTDALVWTKTKHEHQYTSTGIKFWRHRKAMLSYRAGDDMTVISTHISPEGACNLRCPYCSVTFRDTHARINFGRIKDYVLQLKQHGLKAVILTGGGEPVLYPQFNALVQWLKHEQHLSIGLITNGTQFKRIEPDTYPCFSWIRVSINIFPAWEARIGAHFNVEQLDSECVVGCSTVYTSEHEQSFDDNHDKNMMFEKISSVADRLSATYIRVLPNCLLEQDNLLLEHRTLQRILDSVDDPRYFQQYKIHGAPQTSICHQAYFRPYLSEEPWHEDGEPGTVYPCDSVVLNGGNAHFGKQYQICKLEDVSKFFKRKISMRFDPQSACAGCVFTDNVNMLADWYATGVGQFDEFNDSLKHEEFV